MDFSLHFLIDSLFIFLVIFLSMVFLSMEYYARKAKVSAAASVPWMREAVIEELQKLLDKEGIKQPVILELGAGWGALAIAAAKAVPEAKIIGYEISFFPLMIAKLRAFLGGHKHLHFQSRDFFDVPFDKADIVLTYLTEPLMEKLKPKFETELKQGAYVICNTFIVPGWKAITEKTVQNFIYTLKVYVYQIGQHQS